VEEQYLDKSLNTTTNNNTLETDSTKQIKRRKPYIKRKNQSNKTLERFLIEMLKRDMETVNQESAMLNQLITQLEAVLLNIKLKLKYNELQLFLQEYREKISQSNLNINLDLTLPIQYNTQLQQNQYNTQPKPNTTQPNLGNVYNSTVEPKIPDLSAFNSEGTAVLPGGDVFTSTPIIT